MPEVKISPYEGGHGMKTEIDGVEMKDVTDINLRFPIDHIAVLDLSLLVSAPFVFEGPAEVHVHLHIPADHALVEIEGRPGFEGKRMQVTRVLPGEPNLIEELLTYVGGECDMFPDQAAHVAHLIAGIRGLQKKEQ